MTNNAALDGGRETVVQFDHLQHVYPGGVEALKDINLSFRKGEIVAIIGQNGSGKTTLSKHFNGLLRPTSGTVKVCGRAMYSRTPTIRSSAPPCGMRSSTVSRT